MTPETTMLVAFALPLAAALGVAVTGRWPNLREAITLLVGCATFGFTLTLVEPVLSGARPSLEIAEVGPGLAIAFGLEPLGMLFALVASGLWIVTSLYAIGYMRGHHEDHQTRFFVCFALSISAALGIAFSRNLLTLFLFYEALTLSTYPLVTHHGTEAAQRSGRIYLGILMTTSVLFLLFAIVATYALAGTVEMQAGGILAGHASDAVLGVLLVLYTYGAGKAALMPLHRWLPNAMVAPTPVSALLHAVAVVKAGVFTILKVVIYVFGLETVRRLGTSEALAYIAAATILLSSLIAMRQDNLKARLAYSTISQLAYIVLGALLATSASVLGASLHIATHAVGKITLFFCAGAIYVAAHKTKVSQLDGLGRTMPFTMAAFAIAAVSIIGLPPAAGSWSKWYLALGAAEGDQLVFIAVLMVSSLLNIAYLLPIPIRAFFLPPKESEGAHGHDSSDQAADASHEAIGHGEGIHEAPFACVLPLSLTAVGCIVLFFTGSWFVELVTPIVSAAAHARGGL